MSTLTTYPELEQGTDEWMAARCGLLTASTIGALLTVSSPPATAYDCTECAAGEGEPCVSLRNGAPIKTIHGQRTALAAASGEVVVDVATTDTARSLTVALAAERITQYVEPTVRSLAMQRGVLDEPLARDAYSKHISPVTELGFMVRDFGGYRIGYSPDGLVGDDGLIEIKSRAQKKQVDTVISGAVPPENYAQLQCGLLVSGRDWIDYVSYSGGMELWPFRVHPDPLWHNAIQQAAKKFEADAEHIVTTYRAAVDGLPLTERTNYFEDIVI